MPQRSIESDSIRGLFDGRNEPRIVSASVSALCTVGLRAFVTHVAVVFIVPTCHPRSELLYVVRTCCCIHIHCKGAFHPTPTAQASPVPTITFDRKNSRPVYNSWLPILCIETNTKTWSKPQHNRIPSQKHSPASIMHRGIIFFPSI